MAGVEGRPVYAIKRALDPEKRYGVWWWGRSRLSRRQVSEPVANGDGRRYRYKYKTAEKPKEEWIAVPVPDSGIPRDWVDAARERVKNNRKTSNAGRRTWELSGGILRCAECRRAMTAHTCPKPSRGRVYFYYRCSAGAYRYGAEVCSAIKHHRADELEEARKTADRELSTLRGRLEQIRQLEEDKETLLGHYASMVPEALDALDATERHQVYKMLRVEAAIAADGSLEVSGDVMSVCETETSSL